MADDKDREYEKTPTAGKGGSPASSTPNEERREKEDQGDSGSATPKQSKDSAGSKEGGGLH
jgi:hypothetical protein